MTRLEARWKLSQDRAPQERRDIAEALAAHADGAARETAALMRAQLRGLPRPGG